MSNYWQKRTESDCNASCKKNCGRQKKIVKGEAVKELFDRYKDEKVKALFDLYGVEY